MCGEERLLCGKGFTLRVCGEEITVQGRIQDFRGGGGVPTLYINRYMSWEEGGGLQSAYGSIQKLGGGGGGVARVAAFHMPWEGQPLPPLPPKPRLTGKGVEVPIAIRALRHTKYVQKGVSSLRC